MQRDRVGVACRPLWTSLLSLDAIIGITHFAKNTQGKRTADRVLGSQAFAALARMVLVTAKEEDSDDRVFTRDKTNITIEGGGFHYTIEAVPLLSNIIAPLTKVSLPTSSHAARASAA